MGKIIPKTDDSGEEYLEYRLAVFPKREGLETVDLDQADADFQTELDRLIKEVPFDMFKIYYVLENGMSSKP